MAKLTAKQYVEQRKAEREKAKEPVRQIQPIAAPPVIPMAGNAPLPSGASAQIMGFNIGGGGGSLPSIGYSPNISTIGPSAPMPQAREIGTSLPPSPVNQVGGTAATAPTGQGTTGTFNPTTGQIENVRTIGAPAPGTQTPFTLDPTGTKFSTGNAQMDKWLNEQWLPLLEAEFANDPAAVFNSAAFANIKARVEKTWGPIFQNELNLVKQQFDLKEQDVQAQKTQFERRYGTASTQGTELERGLQDIGTKRTQIGEELGTARVREARNLASATQESADAYASVGRAFGGGRMEAERKLQERSQERIADVEKTAERSLGELQTQQQRLESDVPFQREQGLGGYQRELTGLGYDRTAAQQEIGAERTLQEADEARRLRELGSSVIQNPQFYSSLPNRTL